MSTHPEWETVKSPQGDFFSSQPTETSHGTCAAASQRSAVAVKEERTKTVKGSKGPKAPPAPRKERASGDEDVTVYRLLRRPRSPGLGGQDWAIGISDEGTIRIRHGLTGSTVRLEEWPTTFFTDAAAEVEKRTSDRLTQGYAFVGDAVVKRGRLEPKTAGERKD